MQCSVCDMYTIDLIILFIIQYISVIIKYMRICMHYIYSVRTVQWFDTYSYFIQCKLHA